jgi:hypothetical protein
MSTATSGSVGLLQGFRRKIGRYGSATSVADHVDDRDGELDKDAPAPFVNAVREFREQDQLLRRLDGELSAMLEHLQVRSHGSVAVKTQWRSHQRRASRGCRTGGLHFDAAGGAPLLRVPKVLQHISNSAHPPEVSVA